MRSLYLATVLKQKAHYKILRDMATLQDFNTYHYCITILGSGTDKLLSNQLNKVLRGVIGFDKLPKQIRTDSRFISYKRCL